MSELVGLGIFRLYAGLLICTWVPFLLAEEGEKLAPDHLALFMGSGKLMLGVSMVLCPVFGLLNDRTLHPWGRRRAWFLCGVLLLLVGITTCAFASYLTRAKVYFVGVAIWTLGESVAESTTEALVPDSCPSEDFMRAASVRTVMFTAGGLIGYSLIAFSVWSNQFRPSTIYIYYFVTLAITVPWNMYYAAPTDAELQAVARSRDGAEEGEPRPRDERPLWQACYTDTFNASPYFRIVSLVTVIQAIGSTTMMFVSLILHDLVGIDDDKHIQLHMAFLCVTVLVMMTISSSLLAMVSVQNATSWMAIFIICYSVTEVSTPLTYAVSEDRHQRLAFLYVIACIKGMAFGGIYSTMQPIAWSAIPAAWKEGVGSVARATAWLSVCRSLGMGVGNFAIGLLLESMRETGAAGVLHERRYSIAGWVTVHLMTSFCCMVSLLLLHQSVKLKGGVVVT